MRCGAGAGLNIEVCGAVRAPALDDGAVRAPALDDGAVRVRASSLRGGAVAGQTCRPAQGSNTHTATGHLLHPTPSRCWWRDGGLYPCEHVNSRAHPSSRSISRGTTARGPSLSGRTYYAPEGVLHDAFDTHWYARAASIPSAVGGSHASTGRTVETVIFICIYKQ